MDSLPLPLSQIVPIAIAVVILIVVVTTALKFRTSFSSFMFRDDAGKLPTCQRAAERLAPVIGGQVKVRDEGDEVHITGRLQGRDVRAVIWVTFGSIRLEVRTARELPSFPSVHLQFDPDVQGRPADQGAPDAWDRHDRTEQKRFLAPHSYFEAEPDELRTIEARWQQLPQLEREQLVALLEQCGSHGSSFMAIAQTVSLQLSEKLTFHPQAPELFAQYLGLIVSLARAAEERWRDGDEQDEEPVPPSFSELATVPIQQHSAAALLAAALGPGMAVVVRGPDGNAYPATVREVRQDQCLCAFANGAQHWVAKAYLSPG